MRWLACVLALGLLATLAGFGCFLVAAGAEPAAPEQATDGIAVLTGGAERLETGLRLLQAGRAQRLLVSGAHRDVTLADLQRLAGAAEPPLAGRVAIGYGARSTRGNAAEIAAWTRDQRLASIRVVTAGYHMPRALLELRRDLPDVALVPHAVLPARLRGREAFAQWRTWSLLGGEYLKLLAAALGLGRDGTGARAGLRTGVALPVLDGGA